MELETRKRDGSWVSTPVSLVVDGDPDVRLAASDWRGRVHGDKLCGTARLLAGEDDRRVASSINRKYPLLQGIAVRYVHKLMRYQTQHYEVGDIERC
jgi:uncharacterized protein